VSVNGPKVKPKLYLESTVPSYYVARPSRNIVTADQQQQTRDWWEQRLKHFDIFVSQIVLDEIGTGDPAMARRRLELVRQFPMLDINQDVLRLTNAMVERGPLPLKASRDATHIARAAVHKMHFLLTWNCRHIANPTMMRRIGEVCTSHSFNSPVICTPNELLTDLIYEDEGI